MDKTLTCRDCGSQFLFTEGEQEFYARRGFTNEPSRCPDCRAAHKSRRAAEGGYRSQGGYASGSRYGGDRPQRQMYPAICSQCGKETEVPFQPRQERPVYCSDCFAARRGDRGDERRGGYRW